MMNVCIFTDGSCLGNPGPGGWAAILRYGKHEKELVGGVDRTTNNRMELTAVIKGLQSLTRRCQVTVITDSQYVVTILNNGRAQANLDLVRQLRQLSQQHDITVQLVRGHSGHEMNERCDQLARNEASQHRQTMALLSEAISCAA
jgi:ribonuclease HI